jgi:hypothetical protein
MTAEWQPPSWIPRVGETGLAIFHKTNTVPEAVFLLGSRDDFNRLVTYIERHRTEEREQALSMFMPTGQQER